MSHHQSTAEVIIGVVLLGGMLVFAAAISASGQKRLNDPGDKTAVDLAQLPNLVALESYGTYQVTILRQSRNVSSEQIVTGTPHDALAAAMSTFRRAGISAISIHNNTANELEFTRMFYDFNGRASGKKVGRAIVKLIAPMTPPAPPPPPAPKAPPSLKGTPPHASLFANAKCDCGGVTPIDINELEQGVACSSCGTDITPTIEQIARIRTDAFVESIRIREDERAGFSPQEIVDRLAQRKAKKV